MGAACSGRLYFVERTFISLHLLDAETKLAPYKRRLEDTFTASVTQLKQLLPVSKVDVVVYADPAAVIPVPV